MATARKEYTPWIINRISNTTLAKPNTKKLFELSRGSKFRESNHFKCSSGIKHKCKKPFFIDI